MRAAVDTLILPAMQTFVLGGRTGRRVFELSQSLLWHEALLSGCVDLCFCNQVCLGCSVFLPTSHNAGSAGNMG
jgi:hypothetical protein